MRVVVLMSTYKGERYVREQVESILAQLPADGRLVIRDDGSPDATVDVVRAIADDRITLEQGINVGFVRSFLSLIEAAPADADMVMLSDQDDVWLPHKVQRAWQAIEGNDGTPTLYCNRLRLVDTALQPLGLSPDWPRPPSFQNALTENIVTGCTSALNPAALRLFRDNGDPDRILFHDWWLYLVVSAFGRVIFDGEPTILYRQHGGNAIGMASGLARYLTILRFLRKTDWVHMMFRQMENLRIVHGARLPADARDLLNGCAAPSRLRATLRLVFAPRRWRQTLGGDFLFRGLLLANLLRGRGLLPRP